MKKKTILIGASSNPERYSYLAAKQLILNGHELISIGSKAMQVENIRIIDTMPLEENVDTITLYINAANQIGYYSYTISLRPKRIIFNPGAENKVLYRLAEENGIHALEACTLVLLATGQY